MPHNMTVTIEDPLWDEMRQFPEIRWGVVMKQAAIEKMEALKVLNRAVKKNKLSEKEIRDFSVNLGRKINRGK